MIRSPATCSRLRSRFVITIFEILRSPPVRAGPVFPALYIAVYSLGMIVHIRPPIMPCSHRRRLCCSRPPYILCSGHKTCMAIHIEHMVYAKSRICKQQMLLSLIKGYVSKRQPLYTLPLPPPPLFDLTYEYYYYEEQVVVDIHIIVHSKTISN